MLSENRDKAWSAQAIDHELTLPIASAKPHLDYLVSQGLVKLVDGATEERYCFHPSSAKVDQIILQLSNAYATQRVAVLTRIFTNPVDKVRLFTETFRMVKGGNEDKNH